MISYLEEFVSYFLDSFSPDMDIPGPLTSSFRNIRSVILKHFDHVNDLTFKEYFSIHLTQTAKRGARNNLVKPF
jgi:hypothetical protein